MLRSLYDWCLRLAAHPHARIWLAVVAFAESSVFPIPVEAMMLPMMFAAPRSAFVIAGIATVASALGGLAGYAIGYFLFEALGQPILDVYGYQAQYAAFQEQFAEWGWWIVAAGGFTPIPYKVVTIAAGAAALDPWVFLAASVLSRGARFLLEAAIVYWFGKPARRFIEAQLPLVVTVGFILLIGGFVAIRFL